MNESQIAKKIEQEIQARAKEIRDRAVAKELAAARRRNAKMGVGIKPPKSLPGLVWKEPETTPLERMIYSSAAWLGKAIKTVRRKLKPDPYSFVDKHRKQTQLVESQYEACSALLTEYYSSHDAIQKLSIPILQKRLMELDDQLHVLITVVPAAYSKAQIESTAADIEKLVKRSQETIDLNVVDRMERKIAEREKAAAEFKLPQPDTTRPDYYPNIYERAVKNVEKAEARAKAAVDELLTAPSVDLSSLSLSEVRELREKILTVKVIVDQACEVHNSLRKKCKDDVLKMDEQIATWIDRKRMMQELENEYLVEDDSAREKACRLNLETLRIHLKQIRLNSKSPLLMQLKLSKSLSAIDKRLAAANSAIVSP